LLFRPSGLICFPLFPPTCARELRSQDLPKKLIASIFGINGLAQKSRKIFGFKGLIVKILRNRNLGDYFFQNEKGWGVIPHPLI
jgi:hypothetical protein